MDTEEISDKIAKFAMIVAGIIATIISIVDIFGFLNVPFLSDRVTMIILLLMGLLVTFTAFQQRDYSPKINQKIEECTNKVINNFSNVHGIDVLYFENVTQLYDYIASKLSVATKSVDDITWGSRKGYRTKVEEDAYINYVNAIEQICKKGKITYREVSSLTDEHYFRRSINLIEKGYYSYHLGYYDISENKVPLMSYIIIDSNEVMLGFYRAPQLPSEGEVYLSVTQPDVVRFFKDYFDTLWIGSNKVKEATIINRNLINQIKQKLNIKE